MVVESKVWETKAYFMKDMPMCLVVGKMVFHSYVYCNVNRRLLHIRIRMENSSIADRGMEVNPSVFFHIHLY